MRATKLREVTTKDFQYILYEKISNNAEFPTYKIRVYKQDGSLAQHFAIIKCWHIEDAQEMFTLLTTKKGRQ